MDNFLAEEMKFPFKKELRFDPEVLQKVRDRTGSKIPHWFSFSLYLRECIHDQLQEKFPESSVYSEFEVALDDCGFDTKQTKPYYPTLMIWRKEDQTEEEKEFQEEFEAGLLVK